VSPSSHVPLIHLLTDTRTYPCHALCTHPRQPPTTLHLSRPFPLPPPPSLARSPARTAPPSPPLRSSQARMGVQVAAANRGAHSPASASPGSPPKPAVRSAVVTRSASSLPPKTVVILFGWFGAQDRILRKYAELYEGNTDTTVVVRVIADPKDVLLSNKQGLLDVGYGTDKPFRKPSINP